MLKELIIIHGAKVLLSLVIIFIGFKVTNRLVSILEKRLKKRKYDPTIINFLIPFSRFGLKIGLLLLIVAFLGEEPTSFVAVIGGASFAIGLAFQGSLANFAGGLLLLLLKPFGVGDYIEVGTYKGKVEAISIFYTYLNTFDNKMIVLPNSKVSNDSLVNYTANNIRRIDLKIGVAYDTEIDYLKNVVSEIISSDPQILETPEPIIGLGEYGGSSLNFDIKVWVNTETYWPVYYRLNESIKKKFDEKKIEFPYPHMDINVYKDVKSK